MSVSKIVAAAASGVGGAGLDVDEVFSTFVYDGNNTGQSIVNGIDLSGEGGLVWIKGRDYTVDHVLTDTVRGNTKFVQSNSTDAEDTTSVGITAFNSNGFTLGADNTWKFNVSNSYVSEYVSWTFRKAPKFFDVVTWTGNGTHPRTISHNLGSSPGAVIIKKYSGTDNWNVFHRGLSSGVCGTGRIYLNSTGDELNSTLSFFTPSSTSITLGSDTGINDNGFTYVAYLFAHNNSDGEFGPDADQDIIKCGSVTIGGTGNATVNLGFEPQWLLIRNASSSGYDWQIFDTMRGFRASPDNNAPSLAANSTSGDSGQGDPNLTSTGFEWDGGGGQPNKNYIYMAIRRGPLAEPTSATDVFAIDTRGSTGDGNEPAFRSTFPVDFALQKIKNSGTNWTAKTRLIGQKDLNPNATGVEQTANNNQFDYMNGHFAKTNTDANEVGWMWKRAPEYFDVVAYTGTGSATTISHNLGAVPEMMWVKGRSNTDNWSVYHKDLSSGQHLQLNVTQAAGTNSNMFTTTAPTSSVFSLGSDGAVNGSSNTYIAYLFATVAGVSKVGSYTGNSSTQNIDCGFSNGARFLVIKRNDSTGNWYVWDSVRGIGASSDPYLYLNATTAEQTSDDYLSANSSGFSINAGGSPINENSASYIFYAIA